jgi:hypothetical protein
MAEASVPGGDLWFERKHGGSRIWRDTGEGREAFRRSSTEAEEDDQEALKWAALEKLPTYNRLHTAILESKGSKRSTGDPTVPVDIRRLGRGERQSLVEKALATNEQDNERLLNRISLRLQRVGIQQPTVEVRFQNLFVNAEVYVGNRALPTLLNFTRNIVEV